MELLIALLVSLNIVSADGARNLSQDELAKYEKEIIWGQEADDFKGDGESKDDSERKAEDDKIIWGQEADDF